MGKWSPGCLMQTAVLSRHLSHQGALQMFTGSSCTLFPLSGLALLTALPIQIAGWLIHPASERIADVLAPWQTPAHLIMFGSWFLVLLGLPGLYVWQARRAGLLGLVG